MKIFDKRPLSLILCVMLGSFVFFDYFRSTAIRIHIIAAFILIFTLSFFKVFPAKISKVLIRCVAVCALLSVLVSFLYFDLWFRAYDRFDGDVEIEGTVMDMENNGYSTRILLKTDSIDDKPLTKYKLTVYVDSNEHYGFSLGSKIKLRGVIEPFASGGNFDAESYYSSRGISGVVNEVSDFSMTSVGKLTLEHKVDAARKWLCRQIIRTSDAESGGFLCAYLLGQKEYLPLGVELDFTRTGITHILALSGMHLVIIALGFSKLLMFFGVKKKPATISTVLFTIFYVAITGFSASVTRAGIMMIVSSLLFLFARSHDSMTSLFISIAVICVLEPYAIYDLSLWLSAFATLGIVVMNEYQGAKYEEASFKSWLFSSVFASFFAIAATFTITTLKFDGTSILAIVATLLFSFLCDAFLYVGIVLLLIGWLIPVKLVLIPFGKLILFLIKWCASFEWSYISTNFLPVKLSAFIFGIAFFAFMVLSIKRKKEYLIATAISLGLIFCLSGIFTAVNTNKTNFIYSPVNEERIIITDSGEVSITDIASYRQSSAYSLYAEITDMRLTEIDKYVLTHYSSGLYDSVTTLSKLVLIRELYLPMPQNKTEERILFDVSSALKSRTDIILYEYEDIIRTGRFSVVPLFNSQIGEIKKTVLTVFDGEEFHSYLTADTLAGETKNMALEVIADSKTIIFGRHESSGEIYKFTYRLDKDKVLIFSSERVMPDEDTLEHYSREKIHIKPERKVNLKR